MVNKVTHSGQKVDILFHRVSKKSRSLFTEEGQLFSINAAKSQNPSEVNILKHFKISFITYIIFIIYTGSTIIGIVNGYRLFSGPIRVYLSWQKVFYSNRLVESL